MLDNHLSKQPTLLPIHEKFNGKTKRTEFTRLPRRSENLFYFTPHSKSLLNTIIHIPPYDRVSLSELTKSLAGVGKGGSQ